MKRRPKKSTNDAATQSKVKVLYQNLGGVWYAFAENGEEVYFGRVPVSAKTKPAKDSKKKKNNEKDAA